MWTVERFECEIYGSLGPLAFDVHHEVCVRRVLVRRQHLVDLVPAPVEDVDARGDHLGRRRVRRHERRRQQVLQVRPLAVTVCNVSVVKL